MKLGNDYRKRILETRDTCDKKCDTCILNNNKRCIYDFLKLWKKWACEQHQKLGDEMKR